MNTFRYRWGHLPWETIERQVYKLQKRIYQASLRGDTKAVHSLQRLLLKSWSAKCLAVRRVTQDNRGKNTAGIDGVKRLRPSKRMALVLRLDLDLKAQPVRRVWIPKPGTTEKRGLGIPVLQDRGLQALIKLALEPEWEAKFEPNSYGFRPGRSGHDAIEEIYSAISKKPRYVLDADIAKCFDRIDHQALLTKLATIPTIERVIKAWRNRREYGWGNPVPVRRRNPPRGSRLAITRQYCAAWLRNSYTLALSQVKKTEWESHRQLEALCRALR